MAESALFVFDRNPVAFWGMGLLLVAATQYLNLKRFMQTEAL
jgi:hypothetical protein